MTNQKLLVLSRGLNDNLHAGRRECRFINHSYRINTYISTLNPDVYQYIIRRV